MTFLFLSNATNCGFIPIAVLLYKTLEIVNLLMDYPLHTNQRNNELTYVLYIFSDISERNNDYSDTLDFRRG